MGMNNYHQPVLLKEVIDLLQVKAGVRSNRCDPGRRRAYESHSGAGWRSLGIDVDQDALRSG